MDKKTNHQSVVEEASVSVAKGELDFSDPALAEARAQVKAKDGETNWMGMTYVPKTNKLKLIGSGSGGLSDIHDELSEGKVQYFLLHQSKDFADGKAPKLVYICYVGDAVPATIKGSVHKHADEVGAWFGTVALQVNARQESEISLQEIEKKLAKGRAVGYGPDK